MVKRILLAVLLATAPAFAVPDTTAITGTVYLPGGATPATSGSIIASLSSSGAVGADVVAGRISATITPQHCSTTIATLCDEDGDCPALETCINVRIALVPNDIILPANTYYTVAYSIGQPTAAQWTEKWTVTSAPDPIALGAVTRIDLPPGMAAPVSRLQNEGTDLTKRTRVNFVGAGVDCVDDSGNSRTNCTVTSGGGGGSPGGVDQDVQINKASSFDAAPGFKANTTTGAVTVKSLNAVRMADQFSGADACAKIAAAIADLPSTGGVVDARGIIGAQTCTANPFAGISVGNDAIAYLTVLLGATTITTDAQWALPGRCIVLGSGRDATTLRASSSFPTSTALVRLGRGNQTVGIHGTRIENMTLDLSTKAGSIGVYSSEANEQCGGSHLLIYKFLDKGISLAQNGTQIPAHYQFDDLEISSDATATVAYGIYIGTGAGGEGDFNRITIQNGGAVNQPVGVYVGTTAHLTDIHFESMIDGILFDGQASGTAHHVDISLSGTNTVRIVGSGAVSLSEITRGSATNAIRNDNLGTTISDFTVPAYSTSHSTGGYQAYSMGTRAFSGIGAGNVEALVSPNWVIKNKETPPSTGSSVAALSLVDSNSDGFTIKSSSPTAAPPGFLSFQNYAAGTLTTVPFILRSDGYATFLGTVTAPTFIGALTGTASGNLPTDSPVVTTTMTLPSASSEGTCSVTQRYHFKVITGASNAEDCIEACLKNASNTYNWTTVVCGGL